MCWNIDKEIGDNQNKDFAFHKQTKDKLCVDIVGGGRFNEIERWFNDGFIGLATLED